MHHAPGPGPATPRARWPRFPVRTRTTSAPADRHRPDPRRRGPGVAGHAVRRGQRAEPVEQQRHPRRRRRHRCAAAQRSANSSTVRRRPPNPTMTLAAAPPPRRPVRRERLPDQRSRGRRRPSSGSSGSAARPPGPGPSALTAANSGGSPGNGAAIWFASTLEKIVAPTGSFSTSGRTTAANAAASEKNSVLASSINDRSEAARAASDLSRSAATPDGGSRPSR